MHSTPNLLILSLQAFIRISTYEYERIQSFRAQQPPSSCPKYSSLHDKLYWYPTYMAGMLRNLDFFPHRQLEAIRGRWQKLTSKWHKQTCVIKRYFDTNKMNETEWRMGDLEYMRKPIKAFQLWDCPNSVRGYEEYDKVKFWDRDLSSGFGDLLHYGDNRSRPVQWFLTWGMVTIRRLFTKAVDAEGWSKVSGKTLNSAEL